MPPWHGNKGASCCSREMEPQPKRPRTTSSDSQSSASSSPAQSQQPIFDPVPGVVPVPVPDVPPVVPSPSPSPSISLSRSYKSDVVSSIVRDAIANLDRMAGEAEKRANDVTLEIDDKLTQIRTEMVTMVDAKIAKLKAEVHTNLVTSLNKLKSFNSADYTVKQSFICPGDNLLRGLAHSLDEFYVLQGTHILELPPDVLRQIIGYLPPESVVSTRAVCTSFLEAVQTVYACKSCTFSVEARRSGQTWIITGNNNFVTPCMDFKMALEPHQVGLGFFLYITKKRLYAQAKAVHVELDEVGTERPATTVTVNYSTTYLSEMARRQLGRGGSIAFSPVPKKLRITITINDLHQTPSSRPTKAL
ncbi:hypothetical protein Pelo_15612 [Pelomyxa schiedti]|nr:hypothetical protein Pelo_15612 [Pelomyxa schiedti]